MVTTTTTTVHHPLHHHYHVTSAAAARSPSGWSCRHVTDDGSTGVTERGTFLSFIFIYMTPDHSLNHQADQQEPQQWQLTATLRNIPEHRKCFFFHYFQFFLTNECLDTIWQMATTTVTQTATRYSRILIQEYDGDAREFSRASLVRFFVIFHLFY